MGPQEITQPQYITNHCQTAEAPGGVVLLPGVLSTMRLLMLWCMRIVCEACTLLQEPAWHLSSLTEGQ